jgi:hypothetical protein
MLFGTDLASARVRTPDRQKPVLTRRVTEIGEADLIARRASLRGRPLKGEARPARRAAPDNPLWGTNSLQSRRRAVSQQPVISVSVFSCRRLSKYRCSQRRALNLDRAPIVADQPTESDFQEWMDSYWADRTSIELNSASSSFERLHS